MYYEISSTGVNRKSVLSYNNIKSVVIVIEKYVMKVKTKGLQNHSWVMGSLAFI